MNIDGQKIKRIRTYFGLTQLDVAASAGITMATLSKIESGKELSPQMSTVTAIAGVFHCDPKFLLTSDPKGSYKNNDLIEGL